MTTLMERAKKIAEGGVYLGGAPGRFEIAGRTFFITLLSEGLNPNSKVLDIGCGCLRGGYWLIHFLDKGCYFGIEQNKEMVNAGVKYLLEPGVMKLKEPVFDHNSDFNFAIFKKKFDFFAALSIWTHASKPQIQSMLDGFASTSNDNGVFITTYYPATLFKRDYQGESWIGPGNPLSPRGMVYHSLNWINSECDKRGLIAQEIHEKAYKYWNQTWLRIKHKKS
jgi:SAM-dependent methyltransferase